MGRQRKPEEKRAMVEEILNRGSWVRTSSFAKRLGFVVGPILRKIEEEGKAESRRADSVNEKEWRKK